MNKKAASLLTFTALVLIGTYNAVVINSESHISSKHVVFVKRLDDMGVNRPARQAASLKWVKLTKQEVVAVQKAPRQEQQSNEVFAVTEPASAAVQEELSLNLTEVVNPKKWQQGLKNDQFNGLLSTNDGVIQELRVSLPGGDGISVSFTEMTGNVFSYDYEGEVYSGMMYQVDPSSYMVSLTNGPLEGTRLKFVKEAGVEQVQPEQPSAEYVADAQIGTFGQENPELAPSQEINSDALSMSDVEMQQAAAQTEGFNLAM
jgi:hypothetical protein